MPTARLETHVHTATIHWARGAAAFAGSRFDRAHTWAFDGGITVPASAAPSVVRAPYSREDAVDPEEALVAALASCHMLTFLYLAGGEGFCVDDYRDDAVGTLSANAAGKLWISLVTLSPAITFSGDKTPALADIARLHRAAHADCYIANSVRCEVVVADVAPNFVRAGVRSTR